MVIADSSVWIAFQRDPSSPAGKALDRLLDNDEVHMVGPVLAEVLQGARSSSEFVFFASRLAHLPFLATTQATWVKAGELNNLLGMQGRMLALGVLVISVLALEHDVPVYSLDDDFNRVPGLKQYYEVSH